LVFGMALLQAFEINNIWCTVNSDVVSKIPPTCHLGKPQNVHDSRVNLSWEIQSLPINKTLAE